MIINTVLVPSKALKGCKAANGGFQCKKDEKKLSIALSIPFFVIGALARREEPKMQLSQPQPGKGAFGTERLKPVYAIGTPE